MSTHKGHKEFVPYSSQPAVLSCKQCSLALLCVPSPHYPLVYPSLPFPSLLLSLPSPNSPMQVPPTLSRMTIHGQAVQTPLPLLTQVTHISTALPSYTCTLIGPSLHAHMIKCYNPHYLPFQGSPLVMPPQRTASMVSLLLETAATR